MAVRAGPSRSAPIAGARRTGDEVIVEEVTADGWVRVSNALDTQAGYQQYEPSKERWMLIEAADVGVLLRELVLDGNGQEIDEEGWIPELV
jgi:hypothetical protein